MLSMITNLVVCLSGFFTTYASDAKEAMEFFAENPSIESSLRRDLSPDEAIIAMAIVAPEVSRFSSLMNWGEVRTLGILYVQQGSSDFSVGHFQMKPSFIERLEREVANDASLRKKFSDVLISNKLSITDQRKTRVERLTSLKWHTRYLSLFIHIAKKKTSTITFGSSDEKVRYWAALYNGGIDSDQAKVKRLQNKQTFPRTGRRYNYSDIASGFYQKLKNR